RFRIDAAHAAQLERVVVRALDVEQAERRLDELGKPIDDDLREHLAVEDAGDLLREVVEGADQMPLALEVRKSSLELALLCQQLLLRVGELRLLPFQLGRLQLEFGVLALELVTAFAK